MGRLYGLISDVHATRRAPASCTETYLADLLDLLRQAYDVFAQREVSAAIIAGDLFHHKAPTRSDHGLVGTLGEIFLSAPFGTWVVPGNHDMQHDRFDSIARTQPLGVLFRHKAAYCLDGWMGENHPVFGVPWQQRWTGDGIAECLRPWAEQVFANTLIVTHAPIYPPRSEPRYEGAEFTPADWWVHALQDGSIPHNVFYGHIHEPHGTWQRGAVTFCNNGALSRGSLDEHNLEREVGVTLWHEDEPRFEFVPLRARPASEVFRLTEHGRKVTAQRSLDGFLAELGTAVLPRLTTGSVLASLRERGAGAGELALAEELLEQAQHGKADR